MPGNHSRHPASVRAIERPAETATAAGLWRSPAIFTHEASPSRVEEDVVAELRKRVRLLLADLATGDFDMALLDLSQLRRVLSGITPEPGAGLPREVEAALFRAAAD